MYPVRCTPSTHFIGKDEPQSQTGPWVLNVGPSLFFIHLFGFSVPANILTAAVTMKIVFWGVMLHCFVHLYSNPDVFVHLGE